MAYTKADLICVTGFEPFAGDKQNASWEAVRLLPTVYTLFNGQQCRLNLRRIPVNYIDVDHAVDEIWKQDPKVNPFKIVFSNTSILIFDLICLKSLLFIVA